jgi:hypothetical protein
MLPAEAGRRRSSTSIRTETPEQRGSHGNRGNSHLLPYVHRAGSKQPMDQYRHRKQSPHAWHELSP